MLKSEFEIRIWDYLKRMCEESEFVWIKVNRIKNVGWKFCEWNYIF